MLAQHGLCLTSETMRLLKCSKMSRINSGYCHRTGVVEVAKPIIVANAVHQGLQGSCIYWLVISCFKTQYVRSTRSAAVLTLFEMRSWWIAWNVKCLDFFSSLLAFWCWSKMRWLIQAVWEWRPDRLGSVNITFFPRPVVTPECLEQGWGTCLLSRAALFVHYRWRAAKSINFVLKIYHYLTMRKSDFSWLTL